ncbi:uncharacterized protein LOC130284655 [Hyla sarda]|uniref:uncharacterized protein LOC130284655 n=1 Tax=Hyla sarda TaxID=327740 RepID=UPI0024C23A0B|nr:uncharacterized protein LOC130284655 [Hyla sarda]
MTAVSRAGTLKLRREPRSPRHLGTPAETTDTRGVQRWFKRHTKRVQDSSVLPISCFTSSVLSRKYGGISQAVHACTGANVPRKGETTAGKNKGQLIADLVEFDARAAELGDMRQSPTAGTIIQGVISPGECSNITPHQDSTPHEALDSYMRTALQHLGNVDANMKLQLLLQYQTAERERGTGTSHRERGTSHRERGTSCREREAAEREAQLRQELEVLRLRGNALSEGCAGSRRPQTLLGTFPPVG